MARRAAIVVLDGLGIGAAHDTAAYGDAGSDTLDIVFQVAAHEETVPLDELYRACGVAREILTGPHAVSRVIARPFRGAPGAYQRTPYRRDFSLEPTGSTLLDHLEAAGVPRVGVGKVDDLFAGRGIRSAPTATNGDADRRTME